MSPVARSSVPATYHLTLEGLACGQVKSVEGGSIFADIALGLNGQDRFADKHIGPPRYEAFTMEIGLSLSKTAYDWLSDTLTSAGPRHSGAIVACDIQGKAISQREFTNALITEVGFPSCNAASKEPGNIVVKFVPELIRVAQANGAVQGFAGKAKPWLTANFRLQIDGLDCTRVSKVDAFTIKQSVVSEVSGEGQGILNEPASLDFPNLIVTLSEQRADSWYQWHENFLLRGNNGEDREKDGALILLSNTLQGELARIKFYNMGIFSLGPVWSDASAGQVSRIVAGLYCERMEFVYQGA